MKFRIKDHTLFKYEKEADRLRLGGGSWTVNMDYLDKVVEIINEFRYVTELGEYLISYESAFDHGFLRTMGGEQKLIVPVKFWQFKPKEILAKKESNNEDQGQGQASLPLGTVKQQRTGYSH